MQGDIHSFRVGDRVQARTSESVPRGTRGTIRQIFYSAPGLCYVLFDGYSPEKLMPAHDLEFIRESDTGTKP